MNANAVTFEDAEPYYWEVEHFSTSLRAWLINDMDVNPSINRARSRGRNPMTRRLAVLALVGLGVILPAAGAFARGYGRYGNTAPMTPYGPAYDPATWKQAGYNPVVYEQLIMQKMAFAEQQAMMKQQQLYEKMQKAQGKNGQKTQGTFGQGTGQQFQQPTIAPRRTAKKKKTKKGTPNVETTAETDKGKATGKDKASTTTAKPASTTTEKPKS